MENDCWMPEVTLAEAEEAAGMIDELHICNLPAVREKKTIKNSYAEGTKSLSSQVKMFC